MIPNDVLRSLRYTLELHEPQIVDLIALGGGQATMAQAEDWLRRDDDPAFIVLPEVVLGQMLHGLILQRRGADPARPLPAVEVPLTNNVVLKKLRVAFNLQERDLLELFAGEGLRVSKPELSAFFRAPKNPHYRACKDQFLRNFLRGLARRLRPGAEDRPI